MTDANKAYQIAPDRIERAKAQDPPATVLSLSPHFAEDGKYAPTTRLTLRRLAASRPQLPT